MKWLFSFATFVIQRNKQNTYRICRQFPRWLQLWRPFCAILVEGIMGNISVNYFKVGPIVQEMSFLDQVWWLFVMWSKTICAILVEGIMGSIHESLISVMALLLPWQHYSYKTFPENLKHLSSVLTNIWLLEATYVIQFGT